MLGPIAEGEVRRVLGGEVMRAPYPFERARWGDWPKSFREGAGPRSETPRLTGGGGERQVERLTGAGEGRLGAGEPARGGGERRVDCLTGAGDGRLGAGEPARGGGDRRDERLAGAGDGRLGAGEGRLGAGERCLVGGGGERCVWLLRRGVKDGFLSSP